MKIEKSPSPKKTGVKRIATPEKNINKKKNKKI
jgi:hypothetical protein